MWETTGQTKENSTGTWLPANSWVNQKPREGEKKEEEEEVEGGGGGGKAEGGGEGGEGWGGGGGEEKSLIEMNLGL